MSKQYDEDFKLNALKYRKDNSQLTVRAVARNLGISAPTFYIGRKQLTKMEVMFYTEVLETLVVTKLKKLHV